jgi:hypothetical protein
MFRPRFVLEGVAARCIRVDSPEPKGSDSRNEGLSLDDTMSGFVSLQSSVTCVIG